MANPQHVEWLKRGVETWNAQRRSNKFIAYLPKADLIGADLRGAHLIGAELREAVLIGADLRGANLRGANLIEADLQGADVSTIVYYAEVTNDQSLAEYTNLSLTNGLSPKQLESMQGDNGTILPEGFDHPKHWPKIELTEDHPNYEPPDERQEFVETANQPASEETTTPQTSQRSALGQHVELILHTLPASSAAGKDAAIRLRQAINLYHNETGQNQSVEGEMIEGMARGFDTLSDALEALETGTLDKDGLIAVLQTRLQEQEKLVAALKEQLANKDPIKKQVLVVALGAAGGAGLIGTFSHLFGPDGASLFNNLMNLMTQNGTIALPPPPAPTTLPTITTL